MVIPVHQTMLKAVHEFNLCPGLYFHESWIEDDYLRNIVKASLSMGGTHSGHIISSILLEKLGYCYHYDFSCHAARVALLAPPMLIRLIYYTGLTVNCETIRKIVEKDKVVRLVGLFGVQAFQFASYRAGLLKGPKLKARAAYENSEQFYALVVEDGLKLLETCLCGLPRAVTSRVRLKLPKPLRIDFETKKPEEEKETAWFLFRRILISEMNDIWRNLFV